MIATTTPAVGIRIEGLDFSYPDGRQALQGVSLELTPGERVALVGPNGAGKSTLLQHLVGTIGSEPPIWIDGVKVQKASLALIRSRVGVVFQDPDDQLFCLTVFDDVAFGPIYMGFAHDEVVARATGALAQVGLAGFETRMPHHLSLGERKRASLATVLSMAPGALALDEPSAGLDPRARRALIELLATLPQTLLVSTHDLAMVREVFPRTVVMDQGQVVADAPTAAILADAALLARHGLELP